MLPPYSSVRVIGERGEEGGQQIAVRHVQLEHVEAGLRRRSVVARTNSSRTLSMSARVISSGAWLMPSK